MFKIVAIDLFGFMKYVEMDIPDCKKAIERMNEISKDENIDICYVATQTLEDKYRPFAKKWAKAC